MISRRSFLSALAALPFVGKMIPQETITRADILAGFAPAPRQARDDIRLGVIYANDRNVMHVMTERDYMMTSHDAHMCERVDFPCGRYDLPEPREVITFAEWDQRYQG